MGFYQASNKPLGSKDDEAGDISTGRNGCVSPVYQLSRGKGNPGPSGRTGFSRS